MDLSADELLDRKNTLNQFENYFNNSNNVLKNIVEKIGWTYSETSFNKPLVKCPFNNEHRLLPSKLDNHCEACLLKQNGYDSTHSLYPSYNLSTTSDQTMKIDKTTQMNILKSAYEESNHTLKIKLEPREVSQSIERYVCDFTPDERRVLYDSAVKNTKPPSHGFVINDLLGIDVFNKNIEEKPKTKLELLQEQRDLKRRRATYRGKRVHTDRKSYIEVLREVVEGLTSSLTQNDCKLSCNKISYSTPVTNSNNRLVHMYEGYRNYYGNPHCRWLNIEVEESKLLKHYKEKSKLSQNSKDNIDTKKPKSSRSRSKETRLSISKEQLQRRSRRSRSKTKFNGRKYTSSKKSRSPLIFEETKSKWPKVRTKSKEMYRRSRNLSKSSERHHNTSKRHTVQSNSKETFHKRSRSKSMSFERKHEKSKRHRSQSTSSEYNSRKKHKHSKSPINYYKASQSNEENIALKSKSREQPKKKNKHKKSKKRSESPKRSYKSKKNR